jgi:hypothetical protein
MSASSYIVVCLLIGFGAWYYFNKFQESEREYLVLHRQFEAACAQNRHLQERVDDLQMYKDDVSKTFKILDNELVMINDHLQRRAHGQSMEASAPVAGSRISLLTPDMLSSLFANINQEPLGQEPTVPPGAFQGEEVQESVLDKAPSEYDEMLLDSSDTYALNEREQRLTESIKASTQIK